MVVGWRKGAPGGHLDRREAGKVQAGLRPEIGRAMLRPSMSTEGNPRLVRWQGHTVAQLGFVNNTVLALTTASLGFAVSREASGWTQVSLWVGVAFLLTSVLFALCCARNRLHDFRESAQLARSKMSLAERRERRIKNRKRGECTWVLLDCQLATFALGALLVVVAAVPWSKLTGGRCPSTGSALGPDRPITCQIAIRVSAGTPEERPHSGSRRGFPTRRSLIGG